MEKIESKTYTLNLYGIKRRLPLLQVERDMWLVDNEPLSFGCDVEFTSRIAKELAGRLELFNIDLILTVEAKPLALVYEIARLLGHKRYVIARKHSTCFAKNKMKVSIKSITKQNRQALVLDRLGQAQLKGKKIAIIDDVISTCATVNGLKKIAAKCNAKICVIASVWLEGPWPFKVLRKELRENRLIYLDKFPIFIKADKYHNYI